jgi:hypothetical protein
MADETVSKRPKVMPGDQAVSDVHIENAFTIAECPGCGESHEGIQVSSFSVKTAKNPFTHWYTCPTTGDPVCSAVKSIGKHSYEIDPEFMRQIMEAMRSGRFLMALFYVKDGSPPELTRWWKTKSFPKDDFGTVMRDLQLDLEKEYGGPLPKAMTTASKQDIKPLVNLFGAS